ncbi:hypothetical protein SPRG_09277 [Saprolegnia parasitica CBS 223.65]|uniref:Uncharacterized protein n=1 Tax=Saprolegnia parasitica (strain CBS 223.65) TaxID=695850 RepID=A0A067C2Y6_SAPPC|nr:hypothetical protein SPRG_09277 [Saprolegnia parasitica CBS 223.65]KDO25129.1 hypothetical protein SPRG_09277 [Saprolegnia parasitica CBS 223.65]|eukprot:XP_012204198.1 hypothetical protein SPRG_09277 [Saprolegnia parasitica CBS 223.65]
MRRGSGYAVVKEKPSSSTHDLVLGRVYWFIEWLSFGAGLIVVVLVAFDAIANNWAFNDFIGNGYQYMTPVADVAHASQLEGAYAFPPGAGISDLSRISKWMVNYTISNLVLPGNDKIYVLSAGTYTINGGMNLCNIFKRSYPSANASAGPIQLGVAQDAITFLRGEAFSHLFTDDATSNLANASMRSAQLGALGYAPARIQTDIRLTQRIPALSNVTSVQSFLVGYYRIYPKAYCTGCIPIAELGHGTCNLSLVVRPDQRGVTVVNASHVDGSAHGLGLMIQQNAFSAASHYLKFIAMLFAVGGYLASRRTVQWQEVDVNVTETFLHKIVKMVLPSYYPHVSHAIRFDMICYNSDMFVLFFTTSVVLDINHAIIFTREVQVFNQVCFKWSMGFQLFALSTRLLWLNCAFLKALKVLWHLVSTATYCGQSHIMGFFNLRSVTSLYLSAIMLFTSRRSSTARWDRVGLLQSFYVRGSGAIAAGLVSNILMVALLDHTCNMAFWRRLGQNSLARQAIYNSTSILMDDIIGIDPGAIDAVSPVIHCKARRLCTLQWFFLSHLSLFGLPEKELKKKNHQHAHHPPASDTTMGMSQLPSAHGDGAESSNSGRSDQLYLVAQGSDHHFHLLDSDYKDVKSLMFNIKILKNTSVLIK